MILGAAVPQARGKEYHHLQLLALIVTAPWGLQRKYSPISKSWSVVNAGGNNSILISPPAGVWRLISSTEALVTHIYYKCATITITISLLLLRPFNAKEHSSASTSGTSSPRKKQSSPVPEEDPEPQRLPGRYDREIASKLLASQNNNDVYS